MSDTLQVAIRELCGTRRMRRERAAGRIPAVIYGHGQPPVSLSIPAEQVQAALRHGAKLVEVQGAVNDTALIREVQWDTRGVHVLHLDLARVSREEKVNVVLPVELRGAAPGLKEGGIVQHILHEVEIECPVFSLPEKLVVSVLDLHLGGHISADKIPLPEGASLLTNAESIVVQCNRPLAEPLPAAPGADVTQPELIRKPKEEESEEG